nr:hypothetical protein [Tanacetum cinerariifolium]
MISIYAPQSLTCKRSLWSYISSLMSRWNGEYMVMGDFNEVRYLEERMGSMFNVQGANAFNNFISNSRLVEIQLEGFSFTWSHSHLSDHRPVLLREVVSDYGPTPFLVFHSWFSLQGFDQMVIHTWNDIDLDDKNRMVHFKKKLQILKKEIRSWVHAHKLNQSSRLMKLQSKLSDIDKVLDQGGVTDDILLSRSLSWSVQLPRKKSKKRCGLVERTNLLDWMVLPLSFFVSFRTPLDPIYALRSNGSLSTARLLKDVTPLL